MKNVWSGGYIVFLFLISSCAKSNLPVGGYTPPVVSSTFAKGADISWVTQFEASGVKFYNSSGQQQELFSLIKSLGFNSIRLRAWVNPSDGWCNTADVVSKAIRAKNAGMKIMIDFHYSDIWADPGDQNKPAAWASLDFFTLVATMHNYTIHVMDTLESNGITPDWVQIGNETDNGMLWADGNATASMANFAKLIESGYTAVKSVSSTTNVIVHLSGGYNNSLFEWMFDGLKANGAHWDIIGMSLYPAYSPTPTDWQMVNSECLSNINALVSRYSTPVMVVEVGMPVNAALTARDFLTDIITKVNSVSGGNGLGVFYWEPEAYTNGYNLGAFDETGKPTEALEAFGN